MYECIKNLAKTNQQWVEGDQKQLTQSLTSLKWWNPSKKDL